jgi:hypothetical protein
MSVRIALVAAVFALPAIAGAASADSTLARNDNAKSNGNCIGVFSSQVTGNGTTVASQDRQAEIKRLQATCGGSPNK